MIFFFLHKRLSCLQPNLPILLLHISYNVLFVPQYYICMNLPLYLYTGHMVKYTRMWYVCK